jgi:hypothetical protein
VDFEPGSLDRTEGVVERHGRVVARVLLRDDRRWHVAKVPIPGAPDGEKPTHISGGVAIYFVEREDGELSRHLEQGAARRGHPEALSFVIQLDDGRRLEDCSVSGALGGRNGALWFILDI